MSAPSQSQPYPSGTTVVFAGTKRGLFILSSRDREHWTCEATSLMGNRIYFAALDQRTTPRLYAADNNDFFGSYLRYSDDFGTTWHEPKQGIQFAEDSGRKLENIWTIVPGRAGDPETIYAGIAPASLWVSRDRGVNWELNTALESHPTREHWNPGAGGLCLHTIIPDYSNDQRMWLGISAVGCVRTEDGGKTWTFANKGTRADFQPEKYPEWGQCLHRMVQHPTQPDVLYQQNHCGVYKSTNSGDEWIDIQGTLPSDFGFPIALDAHHPDTVFTIVENGMGRHNVGDHFTVYRTRDGGASWETLTEGLPGGAGVKLGVLRHGMCADEHDPCGVYVGTNTGQLFATRDGGDSWRLIADFLPSIFSVTTAVIE